MIISNTEPLDRMNYFNGQRLEAEDFRREQDYHIRVRRLLNSSLYTYGIASGLEVTVKQGDAHRAMVSPGFALDSEGREIVLLEETELLVTGLPSLVEGVVVGNYLTIRYDEALVDWIKDGCKVSGNGDGSQRLAWGGPTCLRASAVLEWQNSWPAEDSGRIVLAQAELDETCAVREIHTGVRKYVGTSQRARGLTYAMEGEKDIDSSNPKQIYFHIRGGQPEAVTLYLRGAKFSSLYYTELGVHDHSLDIDLPAHTGVANHTHSLEDLTTSPEPGHDHVVRADTRGDGNGLDLADTNTRSNLITQVNMTVDLNEEHSHTIAAGEPTGPANDMPVLDHSFTTATVGETGVGPLARTSPETSYKYPADLEVHVDGVSYTPEILNRLGWSQLGDGTVNHDLVQSGTGPIQIDLLGVDLSEGEHLIELRLPSGGGRVLYNLYVE